MTPKKKVVLVGAGALTALAMVPVLWNHSASADEPTPPPPSPTASVQAEPSPVVETTAATSEEEDFSTWTMIDCQHRSRYDATKDGAALAEHLRSLGYEAEYEEKEGTEYFTLNASGVDVEIAIDEFSWEREPWPQARVEKCNALVEEFAAALRERDFEVEIRTNRYGVKYADPKGDPIEVRRVAFELWYGPQLDEPREGGEPEYLPPPDPEAEKAENEALAEYLRSLGHEVKVIQLGDHYSIDADLKNVDISLAIEDFEWEKNGWTPELVEEHNRYEEAVAAHLRERGFACEVKSNQHGLKLADYDMNDEAVMEAVDEFSEAYLRDN